MCVLIPQAQEVLKHAVAVERARQRLAKREGEELGEGDVAVIIGIA